MIFELPPGGAGRRASVPIGEAVITGALFLAVAAITWRLNRSAMREANLVRLADVIVAGPNRERALATTAFYLALFAMIGTAANALVGVMSSFIWMIPLD